MPNVLTILELGRELLNSAALRMAGRARTECRRKNEDDDECEL